MNKNNKHLKMLLPAMFLLIISGCSSVKPWQKMFVNDASMKLSNDKLERFESNFQSYREGAVGAEGGAVGGGCGCN